MQREEYRKVREISYEVHTLKYMFGKKHPPSKERYMPLDTSTVSKSELQERMSKAWAKYHEEKKLKESGKS